MSKTSVGVIRAEVEIYLECDISEAKAKKFIDGLPAKMVGLPISDINVKDNTFYDEEDFDGEED